MKFWVGTSGWSYQNWKGSFYPKGLKYIDWLSYDSQHLYSLEVNNSFYMLPSVKTLGRWTNTVPETFLFSVKALSLITHKKRLLNCEQVLEEFFSRMQLLRQCKLILFQLPQSFYKNLERLTNFIKLLPSTYHYAFEFRHPSWWSEEIYNVLRAYHIAFCIFEWGELISPRIVTTDFLYIRLHGNKEPYKGQYSNMTLQAWATWIRAQNRNTYIYFDNTFIADDAIKNAMELHHKLLDKVNK